VAPGKSKLRAILSKKFQKLSQFGAKNTSKSDFSIFSKEKLALSDEEADVIIGMSHYDEMSNLDELSRYYGWKSGFFH